ncbi:MAG: hypothetical protein GC189_09475 [Alphaproteobacteria bacterium]|nr:hypothetical protein [Alphaproteobacteria bacterium]
MKRMATATAFACAAIAAPAAAQITTSVSSTPVIIHALPAEAPREGLVERRDQPVLRQRATTNRAVAITAPIATPGRSGRQHAGFPAGERLFGVYEGVDRWAYCALREGFWADRLTCYLDTDGDGFLDTAKPSGTPFLGVPFFIFTQDERRTLDTPVGFEAIPYAEGPAIDAGVQLTLQESRRRRGEMTEPRASLAFGFYVNDSFVPVRGQSQAVALTGEGPWTLAINGAEIELSGSPTRGALRYRVVTPLPSQIQRMELTRTITTTTTYVPIYIQR